MSKCLNFMRDKICYEVFADILYQDISSGGTIFAVRVGHNFQQIMSDRTKYAGTKCPRRHFVQGDTLYCHTGNGTSEALQVASKHSLFYNLTF